tara:strand:+ start:8939 stop:9424 length:486 start_codon:yes stop_codon:yes gene_type:complete
MRSDRLNSNSGDYGEANQKVVNIDVATYTVLAEDSGTIYDLNRAGGIVITLPAAKAGLVYEFHVGTTFTGTFGIDAASDADTLQGSILLVDKDTVGAHVASNAGATVGWSCPAAADHQIVADGDTKGRFIGGMVKYQCISESKWQVSGMLYGDGTLATPFT